MQEKPPLLYDVVYPKDFTEKIKRTGNYDILDLARKGMVICFEILQPKELIDEALKQVARICWNPNYENGTIVFNIDDWVDNANKAFKFIKETGYFGEAVLNIFEGTQHLTDVFSIDKQKELDRDLEETGKRPTGGYIAKPVQIKNELAGKKGLEHWLLFLSTHDYLVEGFFLDTLIEIHKNNFNKIVDKNKSKDSRKVKQKEKITPDIPISDGDIPLISSGSIDRKSTITNWSKFRLKP